MKTREKLIREIERMPENLLSSVLKFIESIEKKHAAEAAKNDKNWGAFALNSGAFNFWLDESEVEYSPDDLKK